MEIPLLQDIIVIFSLAMGVLIFCHRLKIPSLVGFLITGVLSGPHGLGLVNASNDVESLATIGIVLLLFTIGMEFSFRRLLEMKRFFFLGGGVQVGLTVLAGFIIGQTLGRPVGESIFLGFLLSLSSTAIVLKILEAKGEGNSPHGRLSLAILIFQDIIAVPMMLLIPVLAGNQGLANFSFVVLLAKGVGILLFVFISAEKIVPKLLFLITKTRSRELFLLSVIVICFSVAWFASSLGLSLAIGAFLAGLIISESEYRHQALGDIIPLQDLFTSFFFVSIGMLLDIHFVLDHPFLIFALTIGVLFLKAMIGGFAAFALGLPLRTMIFAGMALCQVGEFSFVLATTGRLEGIGIEYLYQLFLAVSILSMGLTPYLIALSPELANLLSKLPLPHKIRYGFRPENHTTEEKQKGHVIILGYGIGGKNLSKSCKAASIPYVIMEMNPETVKKEKEKGEPIIFGDATHPIVLEHVNISEAKVLAVVINDPHAARRIVEAGRKANPDVYIIVRTRYLKEVKIMFRLGADDVIADELETSVEIFTRVLNKYLIPSGEISRFVEEVRSGEYALIRERDSKLSYPSFLELQLNAKEVGLETLRVAKGSFIADKTLQETGLRTNFGIIALMIKRGGQVIVDLSPSIKIEENDLLVMFGSQVNIQKAAPLFLKIKG